MEVHAFGTRDFCGKKCGMVKVNFKVKVKSPLPSDFQLDLCTANFEYDELVHNEFRIQRTLLLVAREKSGLLNSFVILRFWRIIVIWGLCTRFTVFFVTLYNANIFSPCVISLRTIGGRKASCELGPPRRWASVKCILGYTRSSIILLSRSVFLPVTRMSYRRISSSFMVMVCLITSFFWSARTCPVLTKKSSCRIDQYTAKRKTTGTETLKKSRLRKQADHVFEKRGRSHRIQSSALWKSLGRSRIPSYSYCILRETTLDIGDYSLVLRQTKAAPRQKGGGAAAPVPLWRCQNQFNWFVKSLCNYRNILMVSNVLI